MPAPSNDNFGDAEIIAGTSGSVGPVTIDDATTEVGEPAPTSVSGNTAHDNNTIWYQWTPGASGTVTLDTFGSIDTDGPGVLDAILSIWHESGGSGLAFLVEDASVEDYNGTADVTCAVTAGTTYYIQIGTYYAGAHGTVILNWSEPVPPENDDFADAVTLAGDSGSIEGDNTFATLEASEPGGHHASVWYEVTPSAGSFLTLSFDTGTPADFSLGVYSGSPVASLAGAGGINTEQFADAPYVPILLSGGVTYHIRVSSATDETAAAFTLSWLLAPTPSPPLGTLYGASAGSAGGKVMKADNSAADAFAEIDLGSPQSDPRVKFDIRFGSAALAYWVADNPPLFFAQLWTALHGDDPDFVFGNVFGPDVFWQCQGDTSALALTGDAWHAVELRHTDGGTSELDIDGVNVAFGPATGLIQYFDLGIMGSDPDATSVAYFRNVEIRTIGGDVLLFADNFASNDLSAWSSVSGDASVVDDPFGGPSTPSDLYTLDTFTAAATLIGAIGFAVTGIAFDPSDGTLYGATSDSLITIDPGTGAGTLVGAFALGSGDGFSDIAFDYGGNLFGFSVNGGSDGLCSIDKSTGAATSLGGSSTSLTSGGGLAFDAGNVPWLAYAGVNALGEIYTLDATNGDFADVGALSGYDGAVSSVFDAFTFGPAGAFFATDDRADATPPTVDLVTIDPSSRVVTLVGTIDVAGMDALAWLDDPSSYPAPAEHPRLGVAFVAFGDRTLAGSVRWVALADDNDLSDVEDLQVRRGRNSILSRCEAGEADITLKNNYGKYDPTNALSSLFGQTLPLRQMQIAPTHPITGVNVPIFTGFIEDWAFKRSGTLTPQDAVGEERRIISDATLTCADGFEPLSAAMVVPDGARPAAGRFYAEQKVQARILALLGDAGWPTGTRSNVFTGNVTVRGYPYPPGTSYLQALFDAADAEFPGVSNCYIDRGGAFRFRGRKDRFNYADYDIDGLQAIHGYTLALATRFGRRYWNLGDAEALDMDATLIPIANSEWSFGKNSIINTALVTPIGVDDLDIPGLRVVDAASRHQYGERPIDIQNLHVLDNFNDFTTGLQECNRYARYYRDNWKDPLVQLTALEVHGHMAEAEAAKQTIWDFCFYVELGDICYVQLNNAGGSSVNSPFFVEGITHTISPMNNLYPRWVTKVDLTPIEAFAVFPDPE